MGLFGQTAAEYCGELLECFPNALVFDLFELEGVGVLCLLFILLSFGLCVGLEDAVGADIGRESGGQDPKADEVTAAYEGLS